jgi:hypothetical protein
MAKARKIERIPQNKGKNYYVVDACFLVNKYIPLAIIFDLKHHKRVSDCQKWWREIDNQLRKGRARVYIPAACIPESLKVLAQCAFHPDLKIFRSIQQYNYWRRKLCSDISVTSLTLRSFSRKIKYHDIPMDRDIIISVDRFYELFAKYIKGVGVIDLSVAATAKYLIDFYDIPKNYLHIITLDKALREGIRKSQDLPCAYDPTIASHGVEKIFK